MLRLKNMFLLAALVLVALAPAQAAFIIGSFSGSGVAQVSLTTIDWLPVAGGTGVFNTTDGNNYFSSLAFPTTTQVQKLDLGPATVLPLANFMSGFAAPLTAFSVQLDSLVPPTGPACVGDGSDTMCQLGAFNLVANSNGTAISLNMNVTFKDGVNTDTPAIGLYTTQSTKTIAQIYSEIVTNQGSIQETYSATFTSIPEPGTYALLGFGLLALGVARRKLS